MAFFATACAACYSDQHATAETVELTLDRDVIPRNGAVTGRIVVDLERTLHLAEFPDVRNGGLEVVVTKDGEHFARIDMKEIFGGLTQGCQQFGDRRIEPGVYVSPILIVKLADDAFIFGEEGTYELEFIFCDESGLPSVIEEVVVVACTDCGESQYMNHFRRREYICPFNVPLREDALQVPDGPYGEMIDLINAYSWGSGYVRWAIRSDVRNPGMTPEYIQKAERYIREGMESADRVGANTDLWRYVSRRYQAIVEKSAWDQDHEDESRGYRLAIY